MNDEQGPKAEALIQISKHRAHILLEALKRYPDKIDPAYKDMVKELEDVSRYWETIESIEIKQNDAVKSKYVNEAKNMKLTGEAAKRYIQKRRPNKKE